MNSTQSQEEQLYPTFKINGEDVPYKYQLSLTKKLDGPTEAINQQWINEVVLWKVDRFAEVEKDVLDLLTDLKDLPELNEANAKDIEDKTSVVLCKLLKVKGIKLPMASTILRFVNPKLYQIIDQRAYRELYGGILYSEGLENAINLRKGESKKLRKIDRLDVISQFYLDYLVKLHAHCAAHSEIPFHMADRILYLADKQKHPKKDKASNLKGH